MISLLFLCSCHIIILKFDFSFYVYSIKTLFIYLYNIIQGFSYDNIYYEIQKAISLNFLIRFIVVVLRSSATYTKGCIFSDVMSIIGSTKLSTFSMKCPLLSRLNNEGILKYQVMNAF